MPIPPLPRLSLYLEPSIGAAVPIASWELPTDGAVDVTPGTPGIDDALAWAMAWAPQEGAPPPAMASPAALVFGADNIAATTTTRYLAPGYIQGTAPPDPPSFRMPVAATLSELRVRQNRPNGNGENVRYSVRVNGGNSILVVNMNSTDSDAANLAATLAVNAGDLIDIQVIKLLGIGTSPNEITASIRIDT